MKSKLQALPRGISLWIALIALLSAAGLIFVPPGEAFGFTGAIYTTDLACSGTNINIYGNKDAVYLDGGPAGGGSGLADGYYYVRVTEPSGTPVLGTSGLSMPVHVTNGKFDVCYKLSAIVNKADNSPGYDTTGNPGGEYKVWVSPNPDFSPSKTDNFKVAPDDEEPPAATLNVLKFYDANANGMNDDSQLITGWKVRIVDSIDFIRFTPVSIIVEPDDYVVTEFLPTETNWRATTTSPVNLTLGDGENKTVVFGNLCLGAGGGMTLGFWSNRNGQALVGTDDLAFLTSLNLRDAAGADFNPATYALFRTWILGASATNMAYMLSAQLAAMELNVYNGKVNGGSLIYAPGTNSANTLGYATVNAVMAEANASLGLNGITLAGNPARTKQEALKNALDKANNNLNFVQPSPCPFTFPE